MERPARTRSTDRAAEIVAALMRKPRTMTELIECLSVNKEGGCKWEHVRAYVQALQDVGAVRVSECRGRAMVFELQRIPFEKPDAEEIHMKPSGEVLEAKLVEFFSRNPDEELSIDDIVAKFGTDAATARTAVYRLSNRGDVVIHHVIRRGAVADGAGA